MKFTDEQLKVLDTIDPYVDGDIVDSRKGHAQIYPVIMIDEGRSYWCNDALDFVDVPDDLVGDWILPVPIEESVADWEYVRDLKGWQRAKQVEVSETRWVTEDTPDELGDDLKELAEYRSPKNWTRPYRHDGVLAKQHALYRPKLKE